MDWIIPKKEIVSPTHLVCFEMSTGGQFKYEEIVALCSYCLSSLTITLLNKAVLSSNQFGMNFLLLAIQALTSVLLLGVFRSTGSINFKFLRKSESIQCKFLLYTSIKAAIL